MSNIEQYIFSVDADIGNAEKKLKEIRKLMNQIERIRIKAEDDYSTTNQKDMDKSMRNMAELTQMYKKAMDYAKETFDTMSQGMENIKIPKNATKEQIQMIHNYRTELYRMAKEAKEQQRGLQSEYGNTLNSFRKLANFQQNYSKNFKHIFSSNDLYNLPMDKEAARRVVEAMTTLPDGVSSHLDDIIDKIKEVNKLDKRTESLSRRAVASKYMSFQQASNWKKDYEIVTNTFTDDREGNQQRLVEIGMERKRLKEEIKYIETNPQATQEEIDKKVALDNTVKALDKEFELRMKLTKALDQTIENVKERDKIVREAGIEVKENRGTWRGMMYERAPAIGLALMGSVAYQLGSMYRQGYSVKSQMRDDVIGIGQRIGSTNWRENIRDNALNSGLQDRLGFTGTQMLQFQQNYLSNRGYSGMEDLNEAMRQQAIFSRVTGTSADRTTQFFDSVFSSANVKGDTVKDVQNAFVGAIKQSGMEGREESQIAALEGILGAVSSGRKMSQGELMNVMGLQSIFSSSGNEALRGQNGGKFLADLNAGIRGGIDDPMTMLMFGQGSQYQGLEGMWELSRKLEKGISDPSNIETIGRIAESFGGTEEEQNAIALRFIRGNLGVDASTMQIKGLMDLYRSGELTQENIDKILKGDMAKGEKLSEEKLKNYQNQNEAAENQSNAVTEKQAVQLNDFGDAIRDANAAMGGLPVVAYATITSLAALAVAAASTGASFKGSEMIRKWAAYKDYNEFDRKRGNRSMPSFGGGNNPSGGSGSGGGWGGFGGGWFLGGGNGNTTSPKGTPPTGGPTRGGRVSSWFSDLFGTAGNIIGGWLDPNARKGGLPNTGPATPKGAMGGGLGRLGGVLGPMGIITALMGGINVLSAPEGQKMSTAGGFLGGLGGAWGGGLAGAQLLSFLGPIGAIVGGIGGSMLGGSLGGNIGEWVGDKIGNIGEWFGNLFKGDKNKETSNIKEQVDRENTSKKEQTERQRADNILDERDLLARQESNIRENKEWLREYQSSVSMSSIYGAGGGVGGATSTGGNARQMAYGNSNAEKAWNFLIGKGFSPQSAAGILGNLQQESGLDPNAVNPSSGAFGIGQWLGGRKKNLFNYAKSKGMDPNSLDAQLSFLWHELNGGDKTTTSILNKKYGGLSGLMGMSSVKNATVAFEKAFERSGTSSYGKRVDYANNFYSQFGNKQQNSNGLTYASYKPSGVRVDSNITVTVRGDERVSDKIKDSRDLKNVAQRIQDKIYGSMSYYANDMVRV